MAIKPLTYAPVQFRSFQWGTGRNKGCKVSIPKDMAHVLGWTASPEAANRPIKIEMSADEKSITLTAVDAAEYGIVKINTTWEFDCPR